MRPVQSNTIDSNNNNNKILGRIAPDCHFLHFWHQSSFVVCRRSISISSFFSIDEHIFRAIIKFEIDGLIYFMMTSEIDLVRKKLVVIGNGNVGKTSLLYAFKDNRFCQDYVPTLFEGNTHVIEVENKRIELLLIDTAGQEEYARLRVLGYPNTQVILICFAFDSPDSLACVLDKWGPEVNHYCHDVPILLIANKRDLRDDPSVHERIKCQNKKIITTEDALLCAKRIGAKNYLECSAKTREGVREVFEYAAKVALDKDSHDKCYCHCILL